MMSAKINHQAREAQIQQFEAIKKDGAEPYDCIDCGWKGTKSQLGGWLGFLGAKEFCPSCGHSEFLVSGDELDAMNREDDTCKLSHPLSCHTNS
jgi:predicted RNA-binding Zn-ribbon protein involved in translation (DUF1610 family)